ncbi:MAG: hypothetical protein WC551_10110 [Patescibacteria group bacterium]
MSPQQDPTAETKEHKENTPDLTVYPEETPMPEDVTGGTNPVPGEESTEEIPVDNPVPEETEPLWDEPETLAHDHATGELFVSSHRDHARMYRVGYLSDVGMQIQMDIHDLPVARRAEIIRYAYALMDNLRRFIGVKFSG